MVLGEETGTVQVSHEFRRLSHLKANDEFLPHTLKSILPAFEPSEPISPGKTNLTFVIEDDDKRVDDSQATNSLIDLATHGFHEWADKGKEAAHQLSSGLRDVGHHLVPATSLEFSNPNSRRSSFNESERPEMPSDAVDLVVEAPGKVDL